MVDPIGIMIDNIDKAFERGLISEKERDEAIDDAIRAQEE